MIKRDPHGENSGRASWGRSPTARAGLMALLGVTAGLSHLIAGREGPAQAAAEGAQMMARQCVMCHLSPGTDALPRAAWGPLLEEKSVMMRRHALRTGLQESILPSEEDLTAIASYLRQNAPTQEVLAPTPRTRLETIEWFTPMATRAPLSSRPMSGYIGVWADAEIDVAVLSEVAAGRLEVIDLGGRVKGYVPVGITPARIQVGLDGLLVPLMEDPEGGKVIRVGLDLESPGRSTVTRVLAGLERPIRAYDGVIEGRHGVLVEEFGLEGGGLRFSPRSPDGSLEKGRIVADLSGVVGSGLADFNGDGVDDLVVLDSQESERLLLYPSAERTLNDPQLIFQGHPGYGHVGLTVADVDQDGRVDLVTVSGDNYDLDSGPLKPYHGLRVFFGRGEFDFHEPVFLPLHGAVKVVAEDFDLDGDLDLLGLSGFPDHRLRPYESAVLYEQVGPRSFVPRVVEHASGSRWFDATAVDMDGDGDLDLILVGAYSTMTAADRRWSERSGPHPRTMLLLRNDVRR